MTWYVFVWFYLLTDHAPWWVVAVAALATAADLARELREALK
jgi:hypothetical protein